MIQAIFGRCSGSCRGKWPRCPQNGCSAESHRRHKKSSKKCNMSDVETNLDVLGVGSEHLLHCPGPLCSTTHSCVSKHLAALHPSTRIWSDCKDGRSTKYSGPPLCRDKTVECEGQVCAGRVGVLGSPPLTAVPGSSLFAHAFDHARCGSAIIPLTSSWPRFAV